MIIFLLSWVREYDLANPFSNKLFWLKDLWEVYQMIPYEMDFDSTNMTQNNKKY